MSSSTLITTRLQKQLKGSLGLLFLHHFHKPLEQVHVVEGAGRGLGVVLDGQDWLFAVLEALNRAVIEVDMADVDGSGEALGLDGVAVVLGRYVDPAADIVPDGVVCAAVAEFELKSPAAEGEGRN